MALQSLNYPDGFIRFDCTLKQTHPQHAPRRQDGKAARLRRPGAPATLGQIASYSEGTTLKARVTQHSQLFAQNVCLPAARPPAPQLCNYNIFY